jgi:glycosyltransferase involved in cell wall biosynthesis
MGELNNNFELNIIWDWDKLDSYQKTASDLKLTNTSFLWKKTWDDLYKFYKESNIFILPSNSKKEWFWIVLLEALSKWSFIITWEKCWGAFILKENKNFWELYDWSVYNLKKRVIELSKNKNFPKSKVSNFLKNYKWDILIDKILK